MLENNKSVKIYEISVYIVVWDMIRVPFAQV